METGLSKDSVVKEGIDIKISQADIIDMLVGEQFDNVMDTCHTLQARSKELMKALADEYKAAINEAVKKVPLPKGCVMTTTEQAQKNVKSNFQINDINIQSNERTGTKSFWSNNRQCSDLLDVEGNVIIEKIIEDIPFVGRIPFKTKFKHSKKLIDQINSHNTEVTEFLASIPKEGINEKEISKKIKNQFTKQVVKAMSPEFRKSLKLGFGITI